MNHVSRIGSSDRITGIVIALMGQQTQKLGTCFLFFNILVFLNLYNVSDFLRSSEVFKVETTIKDLVEMKNISFWNIVQSGGLDLIWTRSFNSLKF